MLAAALSSRKITSGWVRRMLACRNMPVTYLERLQEGDLTLDGLPRGGVRELTEAEITALLEVGKMTKEINENE